MVRSRPHAVFHLIAVWVVIVAALGDLFTLIALATSRSASLNSASQIPLWKVLIISSLAYGILGAILGGLHLGVRFVRSRYL